MPNSSLIFPYDMSNISVLLHKNKFNCSIDYVISPASWGFTSKDSGHIFGIQTDKIVVGEKNFDSIIKKVDTVILLDSKPFFDEFEIFLYAIKSLEKKKNVICLRDIKQSYIEILKNASRYYGVDFICDWQDSVPTIVSSNYKIISPNIPVINISGVAENTGKFETLLTLKESFENMGYRALCISGKIYGEFFGIYSYPMFMFDERVPVDDKILRFNYYINELCYSDNFDLILIEIPGGTYPVSDKIYENFSFQHFLVNNSVSFDLSIVNLLYENYNLDYFDWLQINLKNKYSYNAFAYIVSNNMINWNAMSIEREACYITIGSEYIDNYIKTLKSPYNMYSVFNKVGFRQLTQKIVTYLSSEESFDII